MKKQVLFTAAFISGAFLLAQTPTLTWEKTMGSTAYDGFADIHATPDGGFIAVGSTYGNNTDVSGNHGGSDYWLVKLTNTGTISWQKTYGGAADDIATKMVVTADGGYAIAGYSISTDGDVTGNHGDNDFWVVKVDSTGTLEWQKSVGGNANDQAFSLDETADGGFIVGGFAVSYNNGDVHGSHGFSDFYMVRLNAGGDTLWTRILGGASYDEGMSVQATTDGGFVFVGRSTSNGIDLTTNQGGYDFWVVKLNSTGAITWQKSLGGSAYDIARDVKETPDGGFVVAGYSSSDNGDVAGVHNAPEADVWVVKLNTTGNILWQKALGGTSSDVAFTVNLNGTNGYVVSGYAFSRDFDVVGGHGTANQDAWILALDTAGNLLWQRALGGTAGEDISGVAILTDGSIVAAGNTSSNDGDVTTQIGSGDAWVVKLGPGTTGVNELANNILHVYPNPASAQVYVLTNGEYNQAVLYITDALGRTVYSRTGITGGQAGISIDISSLPQGMYFINLQTGAQTYTHKIIKQ